MRKAKEVKIVEGIIGEYKHPDKRTYYLKAEDGRIQMWRKGIKSFEVQGPDELIYNFKVKNLIIDWVS